LPDRIQIANRLICVGSSLDSKRTIEGGTIGCGAEFAGHAGGDARHEPLTDGIEEAGE
jgi:hypothetical protein